MHVAVVHYSSDRHSGSDACQKALVFPWIITYSRFIRGNGIVIAPQPIVQRTNIQS